MLVLIGATHSSSGDLTERLAKLTELHANGALTDAEFAAAKAKLLGAQLSPGGRYQGVSAWNSMR